MARSAGVGGPQTAAAFPVATYSAQDRRRWIAEEPKTATLDGGGTESAGAQRGDFVRDRARVLHSAAFRRLAGKTQVVAPDDDDVPRTRLTHSLEVAQIARDIGSQLGCDPDLVDLAGLAHDIGHPPFGHNGEAALNRVGLAAGGFEANAQNLRLLTLLERKTVGPDGSPAGLNLTRASLDAVTKYPWPRPPGGGKFGVYDDELPVFGWMREGAPAAAGEVSGAVRPPRCLESQVMDWADDVAYSVHDVEDGILAGRIPMDLLADPDERDATADRAARGEPGVSAQDLRAVLDDLLALPAVAAGLAAAGSSPLDGYRAGAAIKAVTSELTGRFAAGAVLATRQVHGAQPLCRYGADLHVPPVLRAEVLLLKVIAVRYVMADPARIAIQQRQQELIEELVAVHLDRGAPVLDGLFADAFTAAPDDRARLRVVLDQVALLTDAQAVLRHRRLCGTGAQAAGPGPART